MSLALSACIVLHNFMRVAPGVTSFEQHSDLLSFIFHHSHSSLLYYLSYLCSSCTFIIFSSFSPLSASLFLNTTCACSICYPKCCLLPTSPLFLLSLLLLLLNGSVCSDSSLTASVDHHQLSPPLYCVTLFWTEEAERGCVCVSSSSKSCLMTSHQTRGLNEGTREVVKEGMTKGQEGTREWEKEWKKPIRKWEDESDIEKKEG